MSKIISNFFRVVILCGFIWACGEDAGNPTPVVNELAYFPMEKGAFIDYSYFTKTYSLVPDQNGSGLILDSLNNTAFIRQIFLDQFLDIENDSAWRLGFFIKDSLNQVWPIQPDSVASIKLKDKQIFYTLNNRTFVKIQFPLQIGNNWNGNDYNSLPEQRYEIRSKGTLLKIDTLEFPESLEIIQNEQENLIEVNKQSEYYALNIGLALKKSTILQYQTTGGNVGGRVLEKGLISELKIIGNGKIE